MVPSDGLSSNTWAALLGSSFTVANKSASFKFHNKKAENYMLKREETQVSEIHHISNFGEKHGKKTLNLLRIEMNWNKDKFRAQRAYQSPGFRERKVGGVVYVIIEVFALHFAIRNPKSKSLSLCLPSELALLHTACLSLFGNWFLKNNFYFCNSGWFFLGVSSTFSFFLIRLLPAHNVRKGPNLWRDASPNINQRGSNSSA